MVSAWAGDHLLNILSILIIAWVARRVATDLTGRLIKRAVRPTVHPTKSDREKRIQTLHSLATGIIRLATYVIASILIIGEISPGAKTVVFTSAGLIGVALGFGAQNLIKDITSGIFIIIENQYRIGDEVTLTSGMGIGSVEGLVEDLSIRTTVLRDLSGNVHHLPNGNVGLTTNKTLGYSRMNENITVAINTDLEKLEKVIKQVGDELAAVPDLAEKILEKPYLASVKGYDEKGMIVRISAKTSPASQWKVRSEFYRRLKTALDKARIKLAGQTEATDTED